MSNINEQGLYKCCGCGVCAVVCNTGAIRIELNNIGFYEAVLDERLCIDCSLCIKSCYKYIKADDTLSPRTLYIGYNWNTEIRYSSSSGGVGTALAEAAIKQGYTVLGAHLDVSVMRVKHIAIKTTEELELIRGSKYVSSYTPDAFTLIRNTSKIMVIGTPCQIAGLRAEYGTRDDLILVDFRCAGVCSYHALDKYSDFLKSIDPSGIASINMKDKTKNWRVSGMKVIFNSGMKYYASKHKDWFLRSNRSSGAKDFCLDCHHYMNASYADIRMEDAWHLPSSPSKKDLKMGLSQIAVFTDQGEELLNAANNTLSLTTITNTFTAHTHRKRYRDSEFLKALCEKQKTLVEIVCKQETKQPLLRKLFIFISNWLETTNWLHYFAEQLYRKIKRYRQK